MTTLNLNKLSSQELDIEKRKLEASIIPKFNSLFDNMAQDASNIYRATGSLPSQLLADNYAPEFLKEIRDAMRKSIKKFGFNLRKATEKKHGLFFNAETAQKWIELDLKQSVTISDEELSPKLNKINTQFMLDSSLFIANESEQQNGYVTETNAKMLDKAVIAGAVAYASLVVGKEEEIAILNSKLVTASNQEYAKITRDLEKAKNEMSNIEIGRNALIARQIQQTAVNHARSELLASQNVGVAESWARQREAELIDEASLIGAGGQVIKPVKSWNAILDNKTRSSHAQADGQEVGVNDYYIVGGEQLKQPRDPNGSAGNTINCRCNSEFSV